MFACEQAGLCYNTASLEIDWMQFAFSNCIMVSITFILFCANCRACRVETSGYVGTDISVVTLLLQHVNFAEQLRQLCKG